MSNEHDILKTLLLKEELEVLDKLKNKILSEEQFTQEVSHVLAGAIKRAQLKDKSLERALSRPIKNGVKRAFSDNKQSIVDSMLPIMGQLIRKTVTNSIKQFVADINRTLELRFSLKSMKWRWDAKKAGITFAEMVFQKTISYRVKELFVINRESGLLIHHVGDNTTLLDNNAISGMLTVIQDFIADSIQTSETGLLSATIGDASYIVSSGPNAYLASIVKGSATERLKEKSQELIENIHADFSELLSQENQYQNDEEFDRYLRLHLVSKSLSNVQDKVNWLPWAALIIIGIAYLMYWTHNRNNQYNDLFHLGNSIPGFFLQSLERENSGFKIVGLLDPSADVSKLKSNNINLITRPFVSLDPEILQKRVLRVISNYTTVTASIQNNIITLKGRSSMEESKLLIEKLQNIMGVDKIINLLENTNNQKIITFIQSFKDLKHEIKSHLTSNSLTLSGSLYYNEYHIFKSKLTHTFPTLDVNDRDITIIDSTKNIINQINNIAINIPKLSHDDLPSNNQLSKLVQLFFTIIQRDDSMRLLISGESDCQGSLSNEYSLKRAQNIKQRLIQNGIDERHLITNIKSCQSFNNTINSNLKKATFTVK